MTNQTKVQDHPFDAISRLAKRINSIAFLTSTHEDTNEDLSNVFWLISESAKQIESEAEKAWKLETVEK
ncbi:MAG: hypothetical protein ACK5NL_09455 [Vibrio fluvialis]